MYDFVIHINKLAAKLNDTTMTKIILIFLTILLADNISAKDTLIVSKQDQYSLELLQNDVK